MDRTLLNRCVSHGKHKDGENFARKSKDRFPTGTRRREFKKFLPQSFRKVNFSPLYYLQHIPAAGETTPLGDVVFRCQQQQYVSEQKTDEFPNGQVRMPSPIPACRRSPKENNWLFILGEHDGRTCFRYLHPMVRSIWSFAHVSSFGSVRTLTIFALSSVSGEAVKDK